MVKIASISISDYCEATEGMPHDVERLYFRMLLKMLSREGGLPDDDDENARMFGYDPRVYRRLKDRLLKQPNAIFIRDGLLCNERVEADLQVYRQRRTDAVVNGRKGGQSRRKIKPTLPASSPDFAPTSGELAPDFRKKLPLISHATTKENKDIAKPSPTPIVVSKKERESISHTEQAAARVGEGEVEIGHGVFVNCKTIRHAAFTISLPALELGTAGRFSREDIKAKAQAHALQWAAEIDAGKRPEQVVPARIANFLAASIMGDFNRQQCADTRLSREKTKFQPSQKSSTDAIISGADAAMMRNARPVD